MQSVKPVAILWLLIFSTNLFLPCFSERILVLSFVSTKSHKLTYQPLIEELGKRGHSITFVSPVKPLKQMANVTEILTTDADKVFQTKNFNPFEMKAQGKSVNPIQMITQILEVCKDTYKLAHVKALLKEQFDLVFIQPLFNDCALGMIYKLNVPFVLFTPTAVPPMIANRIGDHIPLSVSPNFMLGYGQEMSFYQRMVNFGVETMMTCFMQYWYEPQAEQIYRQALGEDLPGVAEILNEASLILSNGHFSLNGGRPYYPDIVDVGGIHSGPAKPITKELEDFISKGKDGFILFSMGTAIKGDMMPEEKRKIIVNVFGRLKQQVLWKWESETMPDLPENVKLSKWLPQQDLLGHEKIKMFITHCGGGSTEESIYHGVPLVGIPMIADQAQNAKIAKQNGFLVELSWNDFTEQTFEQAINEVLYNPVYQENVKRVSALFKDRPNDPMDLGVYWIEYVLRHKGARHLRNAGRKLNSLRM